MKYFLIAGTSRNRLLEGDDRRFGMGEKPSGYWTIIVGACEVDGQIEVFITNIDDVSCGGAMAVVTYRADAARIPRSDLPVVFRETQMNCKEWNKRVGGR